MTHLSMTHLPPLSTPPIWKIFSLRHCAATTLKSWNLELLGTPLPSTSSPNAKTYIITHEENNDNENSSLDRIFRIPHHWEYSLYAVETRPADSAWNKENWAGNILNRDFAHENLPYVVGFGCAHRETLLSGSSTETFCMDGFPNNFDLHQERRRWEACLERARTSCWDTSVLILLLIFSSTLTGTGINQAWYLKAHVSCSPWNKPEKHVGVGGGGRLAVPNAQLLMHEHEKHEVTPKKKASKPNNRYT